MNEDKKQENQLNIELSEEVAEGQYVNLARLLTRLQSLLLILFD